MRKQLNTQSSHLVWEQLDSQIRLQLEAELKCQLYKQSRHLLFNIETLDNPLLYQLYTQFLNKLH